MCIYVCVCSRVVHASFSVVLVRTPKSYSFVCFSCFMWWCVRAFIQQNVFNAYIERKANTHNVTWLEELYIGKVLYGGRRAVDFIGAVIYLHIIYQRSLCERRRRWWWWRERANCVMYRIKWASLYDRVPPRTTCNNNIRFCIMLRWGGREQGRQSEVFKLLIRGLADTYSNYVCLYNMWLN